MGQDTKLVLGDEFDTAALAEAIPGASVDTLGELPELYATLTRQRVDCLVVPPTVEDTDATDICRGVRGFFPDLPIVVVGVPDVPRDLDVRTTGESDADSVAASVEAALSGAVETHAARDPSRMETLLLSMFDQMPVHLYAKDRAGRHVMTSRKEQEPTSLVGITDLEYTELPADHRRAAYKDDMSVIEDEQQRLEVQEFTGYLDTHTLTSKVPWSGPDGDVVGLAGWTQDITERKRKERTARRRYELLSKVALVAAHEFRNELQVANGRLDYVDEDPEQAELVAESHRRLSHIVDEVVAMASQERTEREDTPFWLSTVGREVWDTLGVEEGHLEVTDDVRLDADPESASLVLQILLDNAQEHAGEDVTVTLAGLPDGFAVCDDGAGLGVADTERVFDAGYSSTEGKPGFGLYVARNVASELGWSVTAVDDEDGARFEVRGLTVVE